MSVPGRSAGHTSTAVLAWLVAHPPVLAVLLLAGHRGGALVRDALAGLDPRTRNVLARAAVIGPEFALATLERVAGETGRLLPALDEAIGAGVLVNLTEQAYRFAEPAVRRSLYDSIPSAERARLHEVVADALSGAAGGLGIYGHTSSALAYHRRQAALLGGTDRLDRAIAQTVAAATVATEGGAAAEAVTHHVTAVALAVRAEWPPGPLGRLMVGAGRAQLAAGEVAAAHSTLAAAARLGRQAGDAGLLAEAALGYGARAGHGATAPAVDRSLVGLLEEALATAGELSASTSGRLRARLAVELAGAQPERARQLANEAVMAARASADPRAVAEALLAVHTTLPPSARPSARSLTRQAMREAAALADPVLTWRARLALVADLLGEGSVAAAVRELSVAANPTDPPHARWLAALAAVHRALLEGRLDDAVHLAGQARQVGESVARPAAALAQTVQLAAVALLRGAPAELAPVLTGLAGQGSQPEWLMALSARVAADRAEHRVAAALVVEALAEPMDEWCWSLLSDTAIAVGDRELAARCRDALAPYGDRWLVLGPAVACAGPVAVYLARLDRFLDSTATPGRWEAAERAAGGTPWQAWLAPASEPATAPRLTRREAEVLALARQGTPARDIAAELVISERTVETHLAKIYRKLGVRSRVELIARHDSARGTPAGAAASPDPLARQVEASRQLSERIAPPPPDPQVCPRPRLAARLAQLAQRRLTVLVAGTGFGKTTLLAGWAGGHPCAWYQLAAEDRDPLALARGLLAALRPQVPELPAELADTLHGLRGPAGAGELSGFVPALATALHERLPGELVLILDDAHLVARTPAVRLLADLCHTAPDRLHLVLACRAELPFGVERLQLHGQAQLLSAETLRFDQAETETLLGMVAGEAASQYGARVHALTGGWPAAVRLVAEALADIAPAARAGALAGWQVPGGFGDLLDDLLVREVIPRLPPAQLRLARVAAPLSSFDAELLAELGVPDAAVALGDARRRGVLVAPVAGAPGRFTLTDVARRHVLNRFGLGEAEVLMVRRAASDHHVARGEVAQALRYLLPAVDRAGHSTPTTADRATTTALVGLLERHGRALLAAGQVSLVATAAATVAVAARTPTIDLLEGEAHQIRGDWDQAMVCLRRLVPEGGAASAAAAWRLGLIHHMRGELATALELYRRGLSESDPRQADLADHALAAAWGASAAWLCGEVDQCRQLAGRAATLAARSDNHSASAAAHVALALLAAIDGDRRANDMHYLRALDHAEQAGDVLQQIRIRVNRGSHFLEEGHYGQAGIELDTAVRLAELADFPLLRNLALVNRAESRRRLGRLEEAARDVQTALADQQRLGSRLASYPLIVLGDVHLDQGDTAQAQSCFEEAVVLAEQAGDSQARLPALAGLALARAGTDPAGAAELAERAVASAPALGRTRALLAVARIAVQRGEAERAAKAAAAAADAAHSGRDRAALAEALEVQAALATDPASRRRELAEAEALWAALECPVGLWRTRIALAASSDPEQAEAMLSEAVAQCRRIGARALADQAAAALARRAETPPAGLALRTLGGFRVLRHGEVMPYGEWRSRKARDLLKILIARRGAPLAREAVTGLLWPDDLPEAAGARLSVALSTLRALLDPGKQQPADHYVASAGGAIWLRTGHIDIDVETFLREAKRALAAPRAVARLAAVEARYSGDFCPEDLQLEALETVREEARAVYLSVVRVLARAYGEAGDHDAAVRCLLRLVAHDPYDEPAQLELVRALDAAGRYGEARRLYRTYTARMAELEIAPAPYPSTR